MRNDTFTVVAHNLTVYQMSVREPDMENDLFRIAFEEFVEEMKIPQEKQHEALWYFTDGWNAAVKYLNDDEE